MHRLVSFLLPILLLQSQAQDSYLDLSSEASQIQVASRVAFDRLPDQDRAYLYQVLRGHLCFVEWQRALHLKNEGSLSETVLSVFAIALLDSGGSPVSSCQRSSSDELAPEIHSGEQRTQFGWPRKEATPLEFHLAQAQYLLGYGHTPSIRAAALLEYIRLIVLAHNARACSHEQTFYIGKLSGGLALSSNTGSQSRSMIQTDSRAIMTFKRKVEETDTPAEAGDLQFSDWIEEDCDLTTFSSHDREANSKRPGQADLFEGVDPRRTKLMSVRIASLLHEVLFRASEFPSSHP